MKGIVLSGREFDNGYMLYRKGSMTKDLLHSKDVDALVNQGLADIDDKDLVSLSDKGKEYYAQYERDKEQNLKEQEVEDNLIKAKEEAIDKIKENPSLAVNDDKEDRVPEDSAEAGNSDSNGSEESVSGDGGDTEHSEEDTEEAEDTDSEGSDDSSDTTEESETDEDDSEESKKEVVEEAFRELAHCRNIALLDYETLTDIDYLTDNNVVATEGVSDLLVKVMPGINNGFKTILNTIKPTSFIEVLFEDSLETALGKVNYVSLSRLDLPVPEGLQVKYLTYLETLESSTRRLTDLPKNLEDFTRYVAGILTNHDSRVSTVSQDNLFRELDSSRGVAYAAISSCFSGGTRAKRKYSELVDRNADWPVVESKVKAVVKELNQYDRTDLIDKAKHLHSLLQKVEQTSKRGGFDLANPNVLKTLAEGAFQLASELEYLSVLYYRVLGLTKAVAEDIKLIKKATSNNPLK